MFKAFTHNCGLKLLAGLISLILFSYVHFVGVHADIADSWPEQILSADQGTPLVIPLKVRGLQPGVTCDIQPAAIVLHAPEFDLLTDEQRTAIKATVDLHGLGEGSYRLTPQLQLPPDVPHLSFAAPVAVVTIIATESSPR